MGLRPIRTSDLETLASWLPHTAAEAGCERWADEAALIDAIASKPVLVDGANPTESFVAYETGAPERNAVQVVFLAVAPGRRRVGSGSGAVLALERRLARSARRCYVQVPARLGLAPYFWLRLGYRPLTQAEWPRLPAEAPAVWMARTLR